MTPGFAPKRDNLSEKDFSSYKQKLQTNSFHSHIILIFFVMLSLRELASKCVAFPVSDPPKKAGYMDAAELAARKLTKIRNFQLENSFFNRLLFS